MPIVSTWVRCSDGFCYENLIYQDETESWFICFDDEEPPELVLATDADGWIVTKNWLEVLRERGLPPLNMVDARSIDSRRSLRLFGHRVGVRPEKMKFKPALSWFISAPSGGWPAPIGTDVWTQRRYADDRS